MLQTTVAQLILVVVGASSTACCNIGGTGGADGPYEIGLVGLLVFGSLPLFFFLGIGVVLEVGDVVGLLVVGSLPKTTFLQFGVVMKIGNDTPFGLSGEANSLSWLVTFEGLMMM